MFGFIRVPIAAALLLAIVLLVSKPALPAVVAVALAGAAYVVLALRLGLLREITGALRSESLDKTPA